MTDVEKSIREEAILMAVIRKMREAMAEVDGTTNDMHKLAKVYTDLGNTIEEFAVEIDKLEEDTNES